MKSKRLKITTITLFCNFVVFTIGLFLDGNPTSLGTGIAAMNVPLVGYIWGETSRPSGTINKYNEKDT